MKKPQYDPCLSKDDLDGILAALGNRDDVLSVRRLGPDTVEAETGFIAGPLCGSGETFLVSRMAEGWQATSQGMWIS
jgi:hypothetical protein